MNKTTIEDRSIIDVNGFKIMAGCNGEVRIYDAYGQMISNAQQVKCGKNLIYFGEDDMGLINCYIEEKEPTESYLDITDGELIKTQNKNHINSPLLQWLDTQIMYGKTELYLSNGYRLDYTSLIKMGIATEAEIVDALDNMGYQVLKFPEYHKYECSIIKK